METTAKQGTGKQQKMLRDEPGTWDAPETEQGIKKIKKRKTDRSRGNLRLM